MLDLIVKLLPEWVLPVVGGALVWFGLNYVFIAPELGTRTIENTCPAASKALCHCVGRYMTDNARLPLALWTASLGLYQVAKSQEVLDAQKEGREQCRKS